jgi:hypothetical protein
MVSRVQRRIEWVAWVAGDLEEVCQRVTTMMVSETKMKERMDLKNLESDSLFSNKLESEMSGPAKEDHYGSERGGQERFEGQ